jgi:hypothetical protein
MLSAAGLRQTGTVRLAAAAWCAMTFDYSAAAEIIATVKISPCFQFLNIYMSGECDQFWDIIY